MELTGKTLELFEEWLLNHYLDIAIDEFGMAPCNLIEAVSEPMRWGVYVDFFYSHGYSIETMRDRSDKPIDISVYGGYGEDLIWEKSFKTEREARTEAIKQANKILNERYASTN